MGGKTSAEAKNRYNAKAYDRISVMLPKGGKEKVKTAADAMGVSVNSYIRAAISEKMEKDGKEWQIEKQTV